MQMIDKDADPDIIAAGKYQFNLKEKLGSGNFGTVYLGRHSETKQEVAIKVFNTPYNEISEEDRKKIRREINFMKDEPTAYSIEFHGDYIVKAPSK